MAAIRAVANRTALTIASPMDSVGESRTRVTPFAAGSTKCPWASSVRGAGTARRRRPRQLRAGADPIRRRARHVHRDARRGIEGRDLHGSLIRGSKLASPAKRDHSRSLELPVTVGRLWARCGHGMGLGICSPQDRHSVCLRAGDNDPSRRRVATGDLVLDGHVAIIGGHRAAGGVAARPFVYSWPSTTSGANRLCTLMLVTASSARRAAGPGRPRPFPQSPPTAEFGNRRKSHRSATAWANVSRCHRRARPLQVAEEACSALGSP
jgi:hypothetical protein